jgi:hypothetical protein
MLTLSDRQRVRIAAELRSSSANPTYVLIYDGQSVTDLILELTGCELNEAGEAPGVARIRCSNYLANPRVDPFDPTSELKIVAHVRSAAAESDWIVLQLGAASYPQGLLPLLDFMASQNFVAPRVVVIMESHDYACADAELRDRFARGGVVDLTTEGPKRAQA